MNRILNVESFDTEHICKVLITPLCSAVCNSNKTFANSSSPSQQELVIGMKLFQDVPVVQQVGILCKWLELKDIVQLDSALCCQTARPHWLTLLGTKCVFPFLDTAHKEDKEWVLKKNIKFAKLRLRHKSAWSPLNRERIFECTGQALHILELCQDESGDSDPKAPTILPIDDIYLDIAEYCPLLTEFAMWGEKATPNLNLLLLKCRQLRSLHMEECTGINASIIQSICNLPKLARLSVSEAQFYESEKYTQYKSNTVLHLFADCLQLSGAGQVSLTCCFPNLLGLCLGVMSSAELLLIAHNCPCMKFANMRLCNLVSDDCASQLCDLWAHIQLLQLRRESYQDVLCNESTVMVLLRGCGNLLKLSVCEMNDPHNDDFLYYKRHHYNMVAMATATPSYTTGTSTNSYSTGGRSVVRSSNVTDLFVDSLTEAHLAAIITLCPRLDTLAIRHHAEYIAPRIVTYEMAMARVTGNTDASVLHNGMAHLNAAEYSLHKLHNTSVRKLHLNNIRTLACDDLLCLTNLLELQLSQIGFFIDDDSVLEIVAKNPNLESLSLHFCKNVTHNVIVRVLTTATKLHTFHFSTDRSPSDAKSTYSPYQSVLYELIKHTFSHVTNFSIHM